MNPTKPFGPIGSLVVSSTGVLVTPIITFLCIPVAIRRFTSVDAAEFLVILSVSRIIAGFDFGLAQLVTPRLRRCEFTVSDARAEVALKTCGALLLLSLAGGLLTTIIFSRVPKAIIGNTLSSDIRDITFLSFAFTLVTLSREFAIAVGQQRALVTVSLISGMIFLAVISTFQIDTRSQLALALALYLISQALILLTVSICGRRKRYFDFGQNQREISRLWPLQMQAVSIGNLAALQLPVAVTALFLSPSDVVLIGVAFQIGGAVRLFGGSVASHLLARMSNLEIKDTKTALKRFRPIWYGLLTAACLAGYALAGPMSRVLQSPETSEMDFAPLIAWGVCWGCIALVPLGTTTALRSQLRLGFEMRVSGVSLSCAGLVLAASSLSQELGTTLAAALAAAAIVSLFAELFGKRYIELLT